LYNNAGYGPTFGGGHDLHISSNGASSYSHVGYSYTCDNMRHGSGNYHTFLAGQ